MQDPYRCLELTVLKKPRSDEARQLLEKVAKQVQPIMRKRQWTVKKLSEFCPRNPGLLGLNINKGAEVRIRLRPARDDSSFYDWNHVLGTMLHELVHIAISPHNAAFYKLLDELWSEAEDLMDRGISGSGQGFDAPSAGRLGSHTFIPTHNPPEHRMADAIRKAAEARARQQSLLPSGPRKLGSAPSSSSIDHRTLTPAQAAAAAAERRARDNVWCGAEHSLAEVEQEVGQQPEDEEQPPQTARRAPAAAAAAAAPAAARTLVPPTGAAQQQAQQLQQSGVAGQSQEQPHPSITLRQQQQPAVLSQQQLALQQQWQQHLQQQHNHRQQQQQQQRRKRPAVDAIDLTLSDTEEEGEDDGHPPAVAAAVAAAAAAARHVMGGRGSHGAAAAAGHPPGPGPATAAAPTAAAAAAAAGVMQVPAGCPCCAAEREGGGGLPPDAAVMRRLWRRQGFQQWCELHRQLQEAGSEGAGAAAAGVGGGVAGGDSWTCSVCTLINAPSVLVCEACLTVKNLI